MQEFDRELDPIREILFEFPITFPPSYPFEEEPDLPHNYMKTRYEDQRNQDKDILIENLLLF